MVLHKTPPEPTWNSKSIANLRNIINEIKEQQQPKMMMHGQRHHSYHHMMGWRLGQYIVLKVILISIMIGDKQWYQLRTTKSISNQLYRMIVKKHDNSSGTELILDYSRLKQTQYYDHRTNKFMGRWRRRLEYSKQWCNIENVMNDYGNPPVVPKTKISHQSSSRKWPWYWW